MHKPNKDIDNVDTLILMALCGDAQQTDVTPDSGVIKVDMGGRTSAKVVQVDAGAALPIGSMEPTSMFCSDMGDEDRLYSCHPEDLLAHPKEVLGEVAESVAFLPEEGLLKWIGIRRRTRGVRNAVAVGKVDSWYEFHCRFIRMNGQNDYAKRLVAFNKKGFPLPVKHNGAWVSDPRTEGVTSILMASLIEDAHRSNAMLATVSDAKELRFPVPLGDYKKIFKDRQAPLKNGRRRPIVHWVRKHLRRRPVETEVKRHVRGVSDIIFDGMRVSVTPNEGVE